LFKFLNTFILYSSPIDNGARAVDERVKIGPDEDDEEEPGLEVVDEEELDLEVVDEEELDLEVVDEEELGLDVVELEDELHLFVVVVDDGGCDEFPSGQFVLKVSKILSICAGVLAA
jgi:hypothetical protein